MLLARMAYLDGKSTFLFLLISLLNVGTNTEAELWQEQAEVENNPPLDDFQLDNDVVDSDVFVDRTKRQINYNYYNGYDYGNGNNGCGFTQVLRRFGYNNYANTLRQVNNRIRRRYNNQQRRFQQRYQGVFGGRQLSAPFNGNINGQASASAGVLLPNGTWVTVSTILGQLGVSVTTPSSKTTK